MVATPFEPKLKDISDLVHKRYRDAIYSRLFKVSPDAITYDALPEDFRKKADGFIACDCFIDVKFAGFGELRFSISYRFRDAERFQELQDVTFTTYNHTSSLPGELHKICVDLFTYGFHDKEGRLVQAVIIDMPELKKAIRANAIQPNDKGFNTRTKQSWVSYSLDDLRRLSLILWEVNR